eukprot:CAMPEP_0198318930 /NCGR_PEP_ID=MMETSP1450-20131203/8170_1 /TAXON_ID=753684 ORGANISM="Madagascaria erythrocladiodes, Strain CCMP3234" /NCGR_SAMPLE_ID=MMETSP1450 /ASSEMBLY_ACC=CAM_ASM_001115 /LENGTH=56 /DNA_ID=CAMNT_0044022277 /DNA_START=25 /DNA_END=191 /DNA_ORIENTATION=+
MNVMSRCCASSLRGAVGSATCATGASPFFAAGCTVMSTVLRLSPGVRTTVRVFSVR